LAGATAVASLASPLSVTGTTTFNIGTLAPKGEPRSTVPTPSASTPLSGSLAPGPTGSAGLLVHSSCGPAGLAGKQTTSQLYITMTYTNAIGQRFTQVKPIDVVSIH